MATPTYTPIASITLSSSASSVEFSSIPQDYRDLVLVWNTDFASDAGIRFRFNSDSGTNYSAVRMNGGLGAESASFSGMTELQPIRSFYTAFWGHVSIMDYTATDKHKTALFRNNNVGEYVVAYAGRWADTSAINTVDVIAASANFSSGSTFALYGIAA